MLAKARRISTVRRSHLECSGMSAAQQDSSKVLTSKVKKEREAAPPPKPLRLERLRKSPTGHSLCDMRPCQQPPDPKAPWITARFGGPAPPVGSIKLSSMFRQSSTETTTEAAPAQSKVQTEHVYPPICSEADLCQARPRDSHPASRHRLR